MTLDPRLIQAEALATLRRDCPACLEPTWWPADVAALEVTCDCGHVLRLEPDGTLYDLGSVEICAGNSEPETHDPHDLEAL